MSGPDSFGQGCELRPWRLCFVAVVKLPRHIPTSSPETTNMNCASGFKRQLDYSASEKQLKFDQSS
ncbi:uncharacterized protein [Physcomitrium patens]|uniref:uncharacterized protein n=1 Tax=Physcomitrium patens TaxID=3218 RepID=UPI003CCE1076